MRRIRGEAKSLHGLLANARFDIDDYTARVPLEQRYYDEGERLPTGVASLSSRD